MSALLARDPLPGHPLVFRIDTRACRHAEFWCKVRQAYLPKLQGHTFWVSDVGDVPGWFPDEDQCVELDRPLMVAFQPEFVRLSSKEREYMRRYCMDRDSAYIRNSVVARSLRDSRLVQGRQISTLGWNSYYLSP